MKRLVVWGRSKAPSAHGQQDRAKAAPPPVRLSLRNQSADWLWQSPGQGLPSPVRGLPVTLPRSGLLPCRTRARDLGGLPRRLRLLAMTALFWLLPGGGRNAGAGVGGIATSASPPRNDSLVLAVAGRRSERGRGVPGSAASAASLCMALQNPRLRMVSRTGPIRSSRSTGPKLRLSVWSVRKSFSRKTWSSPTVRG